MPRAPLPALVARMSVAKRDFLAGAAIGQRSVYVPLEKPPSGDGLHRLEVYAPDDPIPLLVLAKPMGPPTDDGYPLALQPIDAKLPEVEELATDDLEEVPPSARPETLSGRSLSGGKLVIQSLVGTGGAGSVHRAVHRDLRMSVAVKVMHESLQRDQAFARRFHAEALSASRLDHPNLTRVLDFGQEPDGLLYIAMEFLDGTSVRDVLEAKGRLSLERATNILVQVCSGLTHAHARGIVHGDIKPENLVLVKGLDEDGRESEIVKICDFGIAHRPKRDVHREPAGTADYMAPELFRGEEPDAQADVYACGVLLYELLTGVVPIGGDVADIVRRAPTEIPTPPSRHAPGIDPRIDRIVLKALTKEKMGRQQGAKGLRAELKAAIEDAAIIVQGGYWKNVEETPAAPAVSGQPKSDGPDWIERGPLQSMVPTSPSAHPATILTFEVPAAAKLPSVHPSMRPPSIRPGEGIAGVSMAPPGAPSEEQLVLAGILRELSAKDPVSFAEGAPHVAKAIREMLAAADVDALWRIRSALAAIVSENGQRTEQAKSLLVPFADPQFLGPLADKALDGLADRDGTASKLMVRAGKGGSYALYSARVKVSTFESRERFVKMLLEIGAAARPMITAALDRLESRLSHPGAMPIAEDLLKSLPSGADDALGEVVAKFARCANATLALLATPAVAKLWGARAKPLLLDLVDHRNDAIATAAIKALREAGLVDTDALQALEPLVLGDLTTRMDPRIAALEALAKATAPAAPAAKTILARAFQQTTGSTPHAEDVVVVAASSLLAAGGDATLVAERWRKSNTVWLKTRLEAILRAHQGGGT